MRVLGPTCTGLLTGKDPTSAREVAQLSNLAPVDERIVVEEESDAHWKFCEHSLRSACVQWRVYTAWNGFTVAT
jgi:hypothetical protein